MRELVRKMVEKFGSDQKGFTLIELLVVVAILGVLAAVVTPNIIKFIDRSNVSAANAELATVQTAVNCYLAANPGSTPVLDGDHLNTYIRGGWSAIKGEYNVTNGIVTASGPGAWDYVVAAPDGSFTAPSP